MALLKSLGNERGRWEAGSQTFKAQMSTIVGDVLLSAAFMAYAGYFDQHMRQSLFMAWFNHMQAANIVFKQDIARIEVSIPLSLNKMFLLLAFVKICRHFKGFF